jgi:hypothetical protein
MLIEPAIAIRYDVEVELTPEKIIKKRERCNDQERIDYGRRTGRTAIRLNG